MSVRLFCHNELENVRAAVRPSADGLRIGTYCLHIVHGDCKTLRDGLIVLALRWPSAWG